MDFLLLLFKSKLLRKKVGSGNKCYLHPYASIKEHYKKALLQNS